MQFGYLAKMEAVDGECDRQREQAWTPEQGQEKEPPVLNALNAADPQLVNGSPQGQNILWLQIHPDFGWLVLAEKRQDALVIKLRGIDMA